MQNTQRKNRKLATKLIVIATILLLALCAILIPWLTNANRAYANIPSAATFMDTRSGVRYASTAQQFASFNFQRNSNNFNYIRGHQIASLEDNAVRSGMWQRRTLRHQSYAIRNAPTGSTLTVLMHGQSGEASEWSNVGNNGDEEEGNDEPRPFRPLVYRSSSIIERLRQDINSNTGVTANVYVARSYIFDLLYPTYGEHYGIPANRRDIYRQPRELVWLGARNRPSNRPLISLFPLLPYEISPNSYEQINTALRIPPNEQATSSHYNNPRHTTLRSLNPTYTNYNVRNTQNILVFESRDSVQYRAFVYNELNAILTMISYDYLHATGRVPLINFVGFSTGNVWAMMWTNNHPNNVGDFFSIAAPFNGSETGRRIRYDWAYGILSPLAVVNMINNPSSFDNTDYRQRNILRDGWSNAVHTNPNLRLFTVAGTMSVHFMHAMGISFAAGAGLPLALSIVDPILKYQAVPILILGLGLSIGYYAAAYMIGSLEPDFTYMHWVLPDDFIVSRSSAHAEGFAGVSAERQWARPFHYGVGMPHDSRLLANPTTLAVGHNLISSDAFVIDHVINNFSFNVFNYLEFAYSIYNNQATITGASLELNEGRLIIPAATVSGYPVTAIAENAFRDIWLREITIPAGVRYIGSRALDTLDLQRITVAYGSPYFWACPAGILYNYERTRFVQVPIGVRGDIVVPYGITEIPANTLNRWDILSITLPDSVTHIQNGAFSSRLRFLTISASVEHIGASALQGNPRITWYYSQSLLNNIPDSVMFALFANLVRLNICAQTTRISLWWNRPLLEYISWHYNPALSYGQILPYLVTLHIDTDISQVRPAVMNAPNLRSVFSPDYYMRGGVLYRRLAGGVLRPERILDGFNVYADIPYGVTHIPDNFFAGRNLRHIIFPASLICLGNWQVNTFTTWYYNPDLDYSAFISRLANLRIGENVSAVRQSIFDTREWGLWDVFVYAGNVNYFVQNDILYRRIGSWNLEIAWVSRQWGRDRDIIIPHGVRYIHAGTFWATSIDSVTIPFSVDYIAENAFMRGEADFSVYITLYYSSHTNFTSIIPYITKVIVPQGEGQIRDSAFEGAARLRAVDIPFSLNYIGSRAFAYAVNLNAVNIIRPSFIGVISLGEDAFLGADNLAVIFLPCYDTIAAYKNDAEWTAYAGLLRFRFDIINNDGLVVFWNTAGDSFIGMRLEFYAPNSASDPSARPHMYTRYFNSSVNSFNLLDIPFLGANSSRGMPYVRVTFTTLGTQGNNFYWGTIWVDMYFGGYAMVNDEYKAIISSERHLRNIRAPMTGAGFISGSFVLANDIYLQREWTSIWAEDLKGIFDGNNHRITDRDGTLVGRDRLFDFGDHPNIINFGNDYFEPSPNLNIVNGVLLGYNGGGDTINIPHYVTHIADRAFNNNHSLRYVRFATNSGLTHIGYRAFAYNINLRSIILPNSLESIGTRAFQSVNSLRYLTLPSSVTHIGGNAFGGNSSLSITWHYNPALTAVNFRQFLVEVVVPYGVKTIGVRAFDSTANLTSIIIPNSVTHIGERAFQRTGLTHVVLPQNIEYIGIWAFYNSALTSIELPNSLNSIGARAFNTTQNMRQVTIPASVNFVGAYTFGNNTDLTIYIHHSAPTHLWHSMWNQTQLPVVWI